MRKRVAGGTGSCFIRRMLGWGLIVASLALNCEQLAQAEGERPANSAALTPAAEPLALRFEVAVPPRQSPIAMFLSAIRTPVAGLPVASAVASRRGGEQCFALLLSPDSSRSAGLTSQGSEASRLSLPATALFGPRHELNALPSGQGSDQSSQQGAAKGQKRVGKGALALGILGVVGVAAGVVALHESNTNKNCNNGSGSRQVCSDVHTLGEVLIPAGAGVAALGFIFAFRHAR